MQSDRRRFLETMALAAGGVCAAHGSFAAEQRRQVSTNGRRLRVIDAHAHCVIPVQHITKGTPMEKFGGGAGNNLLGPERLQIMDQQGVLTKVFDALSEIPVRMVSCGGSANNVSVLVDKQFKDKALNALNEGLFGLK